MSISIWPFFSDQSLSMITQSCLQNGFQRSKKLNFFSGLRPRTPGWLPLLGRTSPSGFGGRAGPEHMSQMLGTILSCGLLAPTSTTVLMQRVDCWVDVDGAPESHDTAGMPSALRTGPVAPTALATTGEKSLACAQRRSSSRTGKWYHLADLARAPGLGL